MQRNRRGSFQAVALDRAPDMKNLVAQQYLPAAIWRRVLVSRAAVAGPERHDVIRMQRIQRNRLPGPVTNDPRIVIAPQLQVFDHHFPEVEGGLPIVRCRQQHRMERMIDRIGTPFPPPVIDFDMLQHARQRRDGLRRIPHAAENRRGLQRGALCDHLPGRTCRPAAEPFGNDGIARRRAGQSGRANAVRYMPYPRCRIVDPAHQTTTRPRFA